MSSPKTDLLVLKDNEHNLTCRQAPIDSDHAALIIRLKQFVINGFTKQGYEGFSPEIDSYFDPYSNYFYVENQAGKLLAVLRITEKTDRNELPLEQGLKNDGSRYRLDEQVKIADANSFVFHSPRALPVLFAAIAKFAVSRGIDKGFLLLDDGSARFKQIYLGGGFAQSKKYTAPIYFPTFGRTVGGRFQPTYWSILELDQASIQRHSLAAQNY
jgi:hypothetical protein